MESSSRVGVGVGPLEAGLGRGGRVQDEGGRVGAVLFTGWAWLGLVWAPFEAWPRREAWTLRVEMCVGGHIAWRHAGRVCVGPRPGG